MSNISIPQTPVNTTFDENFDHKDYGVSQEIFKKINEDVWIKMMKIYSEILTPAQKNYFLFDLKSDDERLIAFKELVRVKKSLRRYFEVYEQRWLRSKTDDVSQKLTPQNAVCTFENVENFPSKESQGQGKEAKIKHLKNHPEAFKIMKKTGALGKDTFNITVFSRGPTFRVIDKIERSKLIYIDEFGVERDLCRAKYEVYMSNEGTYDLGGPHLCTNDAKVLCALFLIHSNGAKQGLHLHTSFTEIAKYTHGDVKSKIGGNKLLSLKRSLNRLSKATLGFQPAKGEKGLRAFSGSLIQYDGKVEQGEMKSFSVSFNPCIIEHFVFGAFSHIDADLLASLTPWEAKLVMYLSSHDYGTPENPFKMGKEKLKEHLAPVTKQGFGNIKMESFERQLRIAIKSLIEKGYLDPASGIKKGVYIFIKAPRRPFVKQQLKRVVKGPSQNYSLPQ